MVENGCQAFFILYIAREGEVWAVVRGCKVWTLIGVR